MIKVFISKKDEKIVAFEVNGHADSGPYGFDLVCAAVSAVSIGTVNALEEISGYKPIIEQDQTGGFLYVTIPEDLVSKNEIQIILKTMIISLQSIAREYGQFIQINGV